MVIWFWIFFDKFNWITISLTFDENFIYLVPFAFLFLIPLFFGIFYGLATNCFLNDTKKPISNLFLFSLLFGLVEFLRGNILWVLVNVHMSFSEEPEILQILSVTGTYGFNILCISSENLAVE